MTGPSSTSTDPDSPVSALPTLVFDLMDTVVVDPFFAELPRRFGDRLAALREARDPGAWPAFERGELDEEGFLAGLYPAGCPEGAPTAAELRDAIVGAYTFVEGMAELLAELNRDGHPLWALSNYPIWIEHVQAQLALDELFVGTLASYQLRARKPDREAYQRAAARIRGRRGEGRAVTPHSRVPSDPDQLLLVDDRERNCKGARSAGWLAIRFEDAAALRAALADYGFFSTP